MAAIRHLFKRAVGMMVVELWGPISTFVGLNRTGSAAGRSKAIVCGIETDI